MTLEDIIRVASRTYAQAGGGNSGETDCPIGDRLIYFRSVSLQKEEGLQRKTASQATELSCPDLSMVSEAVPVKSATRNGPNGAHRMSPA